MIHVNEKPYATLCAKSTRWVQIWSVDKMNSIDLSLPMILKYEGITTNTIMSNYNFDLLQLAVFFSSYPNVLKTL